MRHFLLLEADKSKDIKKKEDLPVESDDDIEDDDLDHIHDTDLAGDDVEEAPEPEYEDDNLEGDDDTEDDDLEHIHDTDLADDDVEEAPEPEEDPEEAEKEKEKDNSLKIIIFDKLNEIQKVNASLLEMIELRAPNIIEKKGLEFLNIIKDEIEKTHTDLNYVLTKIFKKTKYIDLLSIYSGAHAKTQSVIRILDKTIDVPKKSQTVYNK